jgi:hypothetical protein
MFVKRGAAPSTPKENISKVNNGFLFIRVEDDGGNDKVSKPPHPLFTSEQKTSYTEKSKDLLNYMERSLKINIYDTERYPGMYLKTSNDRQSIPLVFNKSTRKVEQNNNNDNNVINFFKNGQKQEQ